MRYGRIIPHDIANGPGVRTSVFVSGCTNGCKGCFNKEAQSFDYGDLFTQETEDEIISYISEFYVDGLSILGGDPLCQDSAGIKALTDLVLRVSMETQKTVWLWTGFVWENVFRSPDIQKQSLLSVCDVVVDGPFIEGKKNLSLAWRGSSNQRVIDVYKTAVTGNIVLWEDPWFG